MHNIRLRSLLVVLIALILRTVLVLQPIPTLLDKTLPDDAYYYFLTAQHIVSDGIPAVDGIHPSNGWHPLWMLINVGVFGIFSQSDPDLPVRVLLFIGSLCDSLVAGLLVIALSRLDRKAALIAGLCYAVNIMPMFQAVNGLETGLAALMIALAWWTTLRVIDQPSARRAVIWGGVFGLAFLARTDTALILVPLGLYTLWSLRRQVGVIAIGGVVALILVIPWLLWNQANFGTPLEQVSSNAVPWAARARLFATDPNYSALSEGLRVLAYPNYWLRGDYLGAPPLIGFFLWAIGMFGLIRVSKSELATRRIVHVTLLLALGGIALILVHTVFRWYPRPWYFVVMAQSLALALGIFWMTLAHSSTRLIAIAVSALAMGITSFFVYQIGLYPWQAAHQYAAALWLRDNLPAGTRIASMNSGILGYYSGHTTVNLDGVVNPDAFAAIQQNRLLDFMRESEVEYLVDSDNAVESEYALFMGEGYPEGLREIEAITGDYAGLGQVRLYVVE